MRLGVYVGYISPNHVSGAFTFQDSILRCIGDSWDSDCEIIILYAAEKGTDLRLRRRTVNVTPVVNPWKAKKIKLRRLLNRLIKYITSVYEKEKQRTYRSPFLQGVDYGSLQETIENEKIDMVYFATPVLENIKVPYIYTVWDLGHRVIPMFPEVRCEGDSWESRERIYSFMLPRASYIITGNAAGAMEINTAYGILPERIKIIPFFTPDFALKSAEESITGAKSVIFEPYIFYPAQFWAHKNHIRVLQALKILQGGKYNRKLRVVFTGKDKGNLSHIQKIVSQLALDDQVTIKGFVSRDELVSLYRHAEALVYVSYMGPNNLPPLEAMALGCPVIASGIDGHRQQMGEAAWYVDPDNAEDVAAKIDELLINPQKRADLVFKGNELAKSLTPQRYVNEVFCVVNELKFKRECWQNSEV
jgi:glycosyltransferase involved in cell wall biosynthesis